MFKFDAVAVEAQAPEGKVKVAAVTMQKNETILLRTWVRYYSYLFGARNLYILDNGSTVVESLEILKEAEKQGVNVCWSFSSPEDFVNKGKVVSGVFDTLLSTYDIALPLDADEVLILEESKPRIPTPDEMSKHLSSLLYKQSQYLRISTQYDNVSGTSKVASAHTKKCIVKRGGAVELDGGFHMYDWAKKSDRTTLEVSGLALIHFHNRPYTEMIVSSKEKLKSYIDDFSSESLVKFSSVGKHLIKYFSAQPGAEANKPGTHDIGDDWISKGLGVIPFSDKNSESQEQIKKALDPRNFFHLGGRNEKVMQDLKHISAWTDGSNSSLHFSGGAVTLMMLQGGCKSVDVVEHSAARVSSLALNKNFAGYVHTRRVTFHCDISDDIRLNGAPRKHLDASEVFKMIGRVTEAHHDVLVLSGPFRRIALAAAYLCHSKAKIILSGEHNIDAVLSCYKVKEKISDYYLLTPLSEKTDAAASILTNELKYWTAQP